MPEVVRGFVIAWDRECQCLKQAHLLRGGVLEYSLCDTFAVVSTSDFVPAVGSLVVDPGHSINNYEVLGRVAC
jgi:hypothetical protein